jgi:hypothetical protein
MLSARRGEAASPEIQSWAQAITQGVDPAVGVTVEFEQDSNTFIVRLVKEPRVLIFRLSAAQVYSEGRDAECEKTLKRKIKDLWNLI